MNIRSTSGFTRHNLACLGLGLFSLSIASLNSVSASEYQSLESIHSQAEQHVMQLSYETVYPVEFKASRLDNRLKLRHCAQPLHIQFSNQQQTYGRTSLNISCKQMPEWRIHLPVEINLFDDVLVTQRPLGRGQNIDTDMIRYQKHNISLLKQGYFTQIADLKYMQSKYSLKQGSVLTPANIRPSNLVKSGQNVTLILNYKGINIKVSGRALGSAQMGQIVKVINIQSQKIVEGIVSGAGQVKVNI